MEWIVFTWACLSFLSMLGYAGNLGKNKYPRQITREQDVVGLVFAACLTIGLAIALAVTA